MKLWIESAHQGLLKAGGEVCGDAVRIFTTEEHFFAILASSPRDKETGAQAARIADGAADILARGMPLDAVVEAVLPTLPGGEYTPFSILQVWEGGRAHLLECDAPPLFLTREGQLVLLPVLEDEWHGRLVRQCQFHLQAGDHVAMVSEGYIRARGWRARSGDRPERWGWRDVATAIRRWTDTGCDAEQLLGALIRTYHRLAGEECAFTAFRTGCEPAEGASGRDVTVIAMYVRPERTATIWSGPPADPARDAAALEKLMAEPGTRVICGDTTAQIAARLLGADLKLEPRPASGWAEVPPVSHLEGVDLVTEGLVTLSIARERMAGAQRVRDLPRGEDGATCLARVLLSADTIHLIVGLAVNPATLPQPLPGREGGGAVADAAHTVPLRQAAVDELARDLQARGKLVSVEYL